MDADELYRLAPEDFTAARDAAVKQARADGDKDRAAALKALRRPSLAAWLLNRLVADSPELVEQLLALGPHLAAAQAGGDAAALRALGEQRRQLVAAMTAEAVSAADRAVTTAVREEVAGTLEAALADPGSAEAVRSGRLVRALSYAGFGEVDLSGAVAPSTLRPASAQAQPGGRTGGTAATAGDARAREERARRLAEAEAHAHDAAGRLDDAVRACEAAERDRAAAQQAEQDTAAEVDRLQEQLAEARAAHERAAHAQSAARKAVGKAQEKVQRWQGRAEGARAELDRLRREDG